MQGSVKPIPSSEKLRELLEYNPSTGELRWRKRLPSHFSPGARFTARGKAATWNGRYAGKPAFTALEGNGYRCGGIDGVVYQAHRVIWKFVTGKDPEQIDHVNGSRADNRLENLRSVSVGENARNQKLRKSNQTGVPGVWFDRGSSRYIVRIWGLGENLYIGCFTNLEDATKARKSAENQFGYHKNCGRRCAA